MAILNNGYWGFNLGRLTGTTASGALRPDKFWGSRGPAGTTPNVDEELPQPNTGTTPSPYLSPIRANKDWLPVYPDYIKSKYALATAIMAGAFFAPVQPPVTVTVPNQQCVVYPDTIAAKPGLHASQQRAFFFDPDVEVPVAFSAAYYPNSIPPKPGLQAASQRAFFFDPNPVLVVATPFFDAEYPDRLNPLRGLHASQQRPFFFDPDPEQKLPFFDAEYPDRTVAKPGLQVASQRAFFFDPEVETPVPFFDAKYPERTVPKPGLQVA